MRSFSTLLRKMEMAMIFWKEYILYYTYIKPVAHVAYNFPEFRCIHDLAWMPQTSRKWDNVKDYR
jgi:hypothetical protein